MIVVHPTANTSTYNYFYAFHLTQEINLHYSNCI